MYCHKKNFFSFSFRGGSDYLLNICGYDEDVKSLKYAAWPDLSQFDVKLCVESCAKTTNSTYYLGGYESDECNI